VIPSRVQIYLDQTYLSMLSEEYVVDDSQTGKNIKEHIDASENTTEICFSIILTTLAAD